MSRLVFVYGTLKKGFPNYAAYMQSAEFAGTCQTVEKYPLMLNGDRQVPCLVNTPGKGFAVSGELYRVDDNCLQRLDELEGLGRPGGYLRCAIDLLVNQGTGPRRCQAQAYLMKPETVDDPRSSHLAQYTLKAAQKYRSKGG